MPNIYIKDYDWAQSKERNIDDNTLIDLMAIVEYQGERARILEEAGFEDQASPDDALFLYVLDALNVPPEGHELRFEGEHHTFTKVCRFSRMWFEDLFYFEYMNNNDEQNMSEMDVLNLIRHEVKSNLKKHYK